MLFPHSSKNEFANGIKSERTLRAVCILHRKLNRNLLFLALRFQLSDLDRNPDDGVTHEN
jgi:hypothetical protein